MAAQLISSARAVTPGEVVAHMGAVQAQDYRGGLWAVGVRSGAKETDVERAIAERQFVRTWPMRGTLHFVAAADVRWMVRLLTARVTRGAASRHRQLELEARDFGRAGEVFVRALEGGRALTRQALYRLLHEEGISTADARGLYILGQLAHQGLICFGPRDGKQQTIVLLDEWLPKARLLAGDEALAELTRRYFTGHGPATVQDFGWWSGLTQREIKTGLDLVSGALASETVDGKMYWMSPSLVAAPASRMAHLLPPWDEFTVGYRDRSAVIDPAFAPRASDGGMFYPLIVSDGRVLGRWQRALVKGGVRVTFAPFARLTDAQARAVAAAASRYARFLGMRLVE
jgi:hypothetical protein